jgi:hypothetical protein
MAQTQGGVGDGFLEGLVVEPHDLNGRVLEDAAGRDWAKVRLHVANERRRFRIGH